MTKLKKNSSNRQGLNIFPCSYWSSERPKENLDEKLKFAGEDYLIINREFPKYLHKILKSLLLHKVMKHKQVDFY